MEFLEFGYYTCEKYLNDNLIDLCYSVKPDNEVKYHFIPIRKYDMKLLINKQNSLSKKTTVNFSDLKNENFIMFPSDSKVRKIIINNCLNSGFHPNITITSSQFDFITELVASNTGIAILPEFNNINALKLSNNISSISFENPGFQVELGFIINKNRKLRFIVNSFLNYFLNHI